MLADRELATIRAALGYWRDEMMPHGIDVQVPYFDDEPADPLTGEEVDRLRETLRTASLRGAGFVGTNSLCLLSPEEVVRAVARGERVAVVLIPSQDAPGADESLAET